MSNKDVVKYDTKYNTLSKNITTFEILKSINNV